VIAAILNLDEQSSSKAEALLFAHWIWLDAAGPHTSILEILLRCQTGSSRPISGFRLLLNKPILAASLRPINHTFLDPANFLNTEDTEGATRAAGEFRIIHDGFSDVILPQDCEIEVLFSELISTPSGYAGLITVRHPTVISPGQLVVYRLRFDFPHAIVQPAPNNGQLLQFTYLSRPSIPQEAHYLFNASSEIRCCTYITRESRQGGMDIALILPHQHSKRRLEFPNPQFHNFDSDPDSRQIPARESYYLEPLYCFPNQYLDSRFTIAGSLEFAPMNVSTAKRKRQPDSAKRFTLIMLKKGKQSSFQLSDEAQVYKKLGKSKYGILVDEIKGKIRVGEHTEALITVPRSHRWILHLIMSRTDDNRILTYREFKGRFMWALNAKTDRNVNVAKNRLSEWLEKSGQNRNQVFEVAKRKAYVIGKTKWSFAWIQDHREGATGLLFDL